MSVDRSPDNVFVAGIIGVPWQDIRATVGPDGKPFAAQNELHYKTAKQLKDDGTWSAILGEPRPPGNAPPQLPTDALMIESDRERTGMDGESPPHALVAPVEMALNPVNGREWVTRSADLQYACIFPLPPDPATGEQKRDCTKIELEKNPRGCDCGTDRMSGDNNPLCQNPTTGTYGTDQYYAKAYPGLRELEVLRDFGNNAIVASICAKNLSPLGKDTAQDYGYRPAIDAIVDRLKDVLSGRCLPRVLEKDATGKYPCSVIEARPRAEAAACTSPRRVYPDPKIIGTVIERLKSTGRCDALGQPPCTAYQLCEIPEAGPECHHATSEQPVAGWCYVDPAHNSDDAQSLVAKCAPDKQRIIHFVDPEDATPAPNSIVLIACFGAQLGDDSAPPSVTVAPSSSAAPTGAGGAASMP